MDEDKIHSNDESPNKKSEVQVSPIGTSPKKERMLSKRNSEKSSSKTNESESE